MKRSSFGLALFGLLMGLVATGCESRNSGVQEIQVHKRYLDRMGVERNAIAAGDEAIVPTQPVPSAIPPVPGEPLALPPPAVAPAVEESPDYLPPPAIAPAPVATIVPPTLTPTLLAPEPVATIVPPTLAPAPMAGTIHTFGRCTTEKGQGYLCHWSGSSANSIWHTIFQDYQQDDMLQMNLDDQPDAVYEPVERRIHIFGQSGGHLHWLSCEASSSLKAYACGQDHTISSIDSVMFAPSSVALEDGSLFVFFNGKNGLYFARRQGGDFSPETRISECGPVEFSPSAVVRNVSGGQEIHVFAVDSGHRLLHVYVTAEGLRRVLQDPSQDVWHTEVLGGAILNNSPKAFIDPADRTEIRVAALDVSNRPQVWSAYHLSDGSWGGVTQGPAVDVTVSMPPSNYLGVAAVANPGAASTFHIFYRQSDGHLGHVATRGGEIDSSETQAGGLLASASDLQRPKVNSSPAAVADPTGNLHVFAGLLMPKDYSPVAHCGRTQQHEWACAYQTYARPFGEQHGLYDPLAYVHDLDHDPRDYGDFLQTTYYSDPVHPTQGYSGMSVLFVPTAAISSSEATAVPPTLNPLPLRPEATVVTPSLTVAPLAPKATAVPPTLEPVTL
jgi:hypothetical protein